MNFWRNLYTRMTDTGVWVFIAVLCLLSAYFTWDVQVRRGAWRSDEGAVTLQSGTAVRLVQVIDGDEVSVAHQTGTVVVRLLGIKAFDPNVQDPSISGAGLACVEGLTQLLQREVPLELVYDALRFDKAGRLLAYLESEKVDVGLRLVEQGLALAYTRYPFARQAAYEQAQQSAREKRAGLWLHPKATQRAEALIQSWAAER